MRKTEARRDDFSVLVFLGLPRTILSGGFSGICYWSAIYPIDVLKCKQKAFDFAFILPFFLARIQVHGRAPLGDVLRNLLIEDGQRCFFCIFMLQTLKLLGASSLFKGLTATLLRAFFSNSALLLTYENTRKSLEYLLIT